MPAETIRGKPSRQQIDPSIFILTLRPAAHILAAIKPVYLKRYPRRSAMLVLKGTQLRHAAKQAVHFEGKEYS